MRHFLDRCARGLAILLVRVFFRQVEVTGLDRVPREGRLLVVANHGNGLIDPLLLIALVPRTLRFLAKSTLWSNPAVRPLLGLAGAIPVYRRQDGVDPAQNDATFARCFDELEKGCAVALFPEGISHDAPALQTLKTGAARIALGAEDRWPDTGVAVVPVGLTFEGREEFRSRLLVSFGAPLARPEPEADEPSRVRALTREIDSGLRRVTLNFESWETAELLGRAAEIYGSEGSPMPGRPGLHRRFSIHQAFGEAYERARAASPERVSDIEAMAKRYNAILGSLGVRDDHVTARYPWTRAIGYVSHRIPLMLLRLPVALVGMLLNYLPYRAPGLVASLVGGSRDQPATYKLITGLFLFPLFWIGEAIAAGQLWGATAAAVTAFLAPASGWVALRFHERNESFFAELRAYTSLRFHGSRREELRVLRGFLRDEIQALVEAPPDPEVPTAGESPRHDAG